MVHGQEATRGERALAFYNEAKAFFSSGVFYIIIGCVFLFVGYRISVTAHSAFVFLLAILGVALVLYGTGTNAAGSGSTGTIKVAIAGGAGVLALLLGFGVVREREGLVDVFKHQRDYGVLDLTVSPESGIPVDLSGFDVKARLGGLVPLPLFNEAQKVRIIVPIPDEVDTKTIVSVSFRPKLGVDRASNAAGQDHEVSVNWGVADHTTGFANEKIKVSQAKIRPRETREKTIQSVPDSSTYLPSEQFTFIPQ